MPGPEDDLSERPDVDNLIAIYAALSEQDAAIVKEKYAGQQFGSFKPALADLAVAKMEPITDLMNRYLSDPEEIDNILKRAADKATDIAEPILAETRKIIGFWGA